MALNVTGRQIVVLQRGYVLVGDVETTGETVHIRNAACIRRWGTKRGLGQLATEGAQPNTALDPQPDTSVHELAVVQCIAVSTSPAQPSEEPVI